MKIDLDQGIFDCFIRDISGFIIIFIMLFLQLKGHLITAWYFLFSNNQFVMWMQEGRKWHFGWNRVFCKYRKYM